MRNAWEWEHETEVSETVKRTKRRFSVGPIVVWAIVVLTLLFLGREIPAHVWNYLGTLSSFS